MLGRKTTIGRTPDNDLMIDAKFISRHHAVILAGPTHTIIEDLNSTNGVLVERAPDYAPDSEGQRHCPCGQGAVPLRRASDGRPPLKDSAACKTGAQQFYPRLGAALAAQNAVQTVSARGRAMAHAVDNHSQQAFSKY